MLKTPLPKYDFRNVKFSITNLNENYAAINRKPTILSKHEVHHKNRRKKKEKFATWKAIKTG